MGKFILVTKHAGCILVVPYLPAKGGAADESKWRIINLQEHIYISKDAPDSHSFRELFVSYFRTNKTLTLPKGVSAVLPEEQNTI